MKGEVQQDLFLCDLFAGQGGRELTWLWDRHWQIHTHTRTHSLTVHYEVIQAVED